MAAPPAQRGDRANRTAWLASACAAAMIAAQVGSKSTRDAMFLSAFEARWLPPMVIGAALLSLATVPILAALNVRWSPQRVVPRVYLGTSALVLGVWGTQRMLPELAAILFFLVVASAGALLISGFWSVVNERFEPRSGKRYFARIGGAATAGGLAGGLLVERMAAAGAVDFVLPVVATLWLTCGLLVARVGRASSSPGGPPSVPIDGAPGALRLLRERSYLRDMAVLIVLLSASAGVIDYVFKAQAAEAYDRAGLMRFFAAFYTGVGLLTFVVQSLFTAKLLQRVGLGPAVSSLPGAIVAGTAVGVIVPGLGSAAAARALEDATRNSTFRSGYELLYVPVARAEKRRVKIIVDVAFDRIGSTAGGLLVSGALLVGLADPRVLLVAAMLLAGIAWLVTRRMERGYTDALERSLVAQADALDLTEGVVDGTMRSLLHQTIGELAIDPNDPLASQRMSRRLLSGGVGKLDLPSVSAASPSPAQGGARAPQPTPPAAHGVSPRRAASSAPPAAAQALRPVSGTPLVVQVEDLRSGDLERIEHALAQLQTTELVGHVIPLLAWDRAANAALEALRRVAPRCTGQLLDALLDPRTPFATRRRLPRALAYAGNERAIWGLLEALEDERFEVRYHTGRALLRLCDEQQTVLDADEIYELIERETRVEHGVWTALRLLDEGVYADSGEGAEIDADTPGLAHVFNLLSLILPREPLRIAYRGLHTDDPRLRGTALEYLDRVLPPRVQAALDGVVQRGAGRTERRATNGAGSDALEALMRSRDSISRSLAAIRTSREQRPDEIPGEGQDEEGRS
jgi:AAA family ATP:ADP antiporter